jgi:ATP-binding cassette subfamily B protein RaxB
VLLQTGTAALRSWAVLHLSATLNLQWLGNVFAHLMRLPVAWFEQAPRRRRVVALRVRAADPEDADDALRRGLIDGLLVVPRWR